MIESATKKHLAARKAPRREKHSTSYTFPPKEVVLLIKPEGTFIETTVAGDPRMSGRKAFTAIQVQLPNGRTVSIQDLVENYAC